MQILKRVGFLEDFSASGLKLLEVSCARLDLGLQKRRSH